MAVSEQQVLDALRSVIDPDLNADIVRLGFVKDVVIDGGRVSFKVELTTPACPVKEILEQQAKEAVSGIEGVDQVEIEMTSRVRDRKIRKEDRVPSVRQIVAIASGKGGVGADIRASENPITACDERATMTGHARVSRPPRLSRCMPFEPWTYSTPEEGRDL